MTNYKNMTNEEIKEQLEWSDSHEFSYGYSIWAFEEIERLNNIINEIYMFLSQYTITHTWQKIIIEDTIKYIEELKGSDKE